MQDAFADGTLLWYWYDAWIVVPAAVIVGLLTLWMLVQTPWTRPVSLGLKILAVVGVLPMGIVALDRIGLATGINDPDIFGYVSIAGAAAALVLSLAGIAFRRRLAGTAASAVDTGFATQTGMATNTQVTPEDGTMAPTMVEEAGADATMGVDASETDDATQVAPGGDDSATIVMGGAAATQMISARGPAASLKVRTGSEAGQTFTLDADETTIGRSQGNTIILQDTTISRNHARIVREAGGYVIEDLGSTSGTTVDGTRAERQVLQSGSVVRIGETELAFEVEGVPDAAAAGDARTMVAPSGAPASSDSTMILGREETPRAAAWFLVRKGNQAGRSFNLSGDSVTIGRTPENDIQLDDTAASTSHALVRLADNAYRLYDLGSSNGTRINGQAVTGAALRDGSRILIGQSELAFTEVAGGGAPQAAAPAQGGQTMVMSSSEEKQGVLLVRSGPAAGQSFPLGEQDTVIGREPGAGGAVVNDAAVSRRHAIIRKTPDGYAIFDMGSTGGTTVDGVTLAGHELRDGDVVEIGTTELQFVRPQSS